MEMSKSFSVLLLILISMDFIQCKYIEGNVATNERWVFLTKFCFLSGEGKFQFDVSYDIIRGSHQKLILYYDEPHQWDAAYLTDTSCEEKEAVADVRNNQYINLTLYSKDSDCEIMRSNSGNVSTYQCTGFRSFNSRRERWWYIAVSNCDSSKGLQLEYKLTLTNGFNFWYKHFSADEFYILRTNCAAMVLELGVLFLSILAAAKMRENYLLHSTYYLFMMSVALSVLGLLLLCIHYARYGVDGVGIPICKLIGRIVTCSSTIITVLYLLLIAEGLGITRYKLRQPRVILICTLLNFFIGAYLFLFVWEQIWFLPGEVRHLYQSYAGYGLAVLRVVGCVVFTYLSFVTARQFPLKTKFYVPFTLFYILWFILGVVIILTANLAIHPWMRESVVYGVERTLDLIFHFFFLVITCPLLANPVFPFHPKQTVVLDLRIRIKN